MAAKQYWYANDGRGLTDSCNANANNDNDEDVDDDDARDHARKMTGKP